MDDVPGEVESALIDLSEFDIADLEALANPVLASTLSKVFGEFQTPEEALPRFDSSL